MTIKYKQFVLRPGPFAKDRFDLMRVKPLFMAKNNKMMRDKYGDVPVGTLVGETEEEIGLDMRLESALQTLISILLSEKDDTVDLKSYLQEYKKYKDEIMSLLK